MEAYGIDTILWEFQGTPREIELCPKKDILKGHMFFPTIICVCDKDAEGEVLTVFSFWGCILFMQGPLGVRKFDAF